MYLGDLVEEDDRKFKASLFDIVERMLERMLRDLDGVIAMDLPRFVTPLTHVIDRDDVYEVVFELLECVDPDPIVKIDERGIFVKALGEHTCLKTVELPPGLDVDKAEVKKLGDLLIVKIPKKTLKPTSVKH